ncbi:MAG: class I SAM-dependent methyltransferase [Anaerolineae bacterium]|nr:class I SAM-dependent methyltransferase [Anaerolineae bacterium]
MSPAPPAGSLSASRVLYDESYYRDNRNNYRERLEFRVANFWRAAYVELCFRPASVLDAGGGMGLLVERLRSWGRAALGLELSRYAITQAPDSVRRCFVQGSLVSLPFADRSFDVVVSVNVLEHLEPGEVAGALRECARVARKGIFHEITVLEDRDVIHRDPTHRTKLSAAAWLEVLGNELPGWQPRRGLHIPRFKNGVFVLRRMGMER